MTKTRKLGLIWLFGGLAVVTVGVLLMSTSLPIGLLIYGSAFYPIWKSNQLL